MAESRCCSLARRCGCWAARRSRPYSSSHAVMIERPMALLLCAESFRRIEEELVRSRSIHAVVSSRYTALIPGPYRRVCRGRHVAPGPGGAPAQNHEGTRRGLRTVPPSDRLFLGMSTIGLPKRFTKTLLPVTRYSFGSLTAWLRPVIKTFASATAGRGPTFPGWPRCFSVDLVISARLLDDTYQVIAIGWASVNPHWGLGGLGGLGLALCRAKILESMVWLASAFENEQVNSRKTL